MSDASDPAFWEKFWGGLIAAGAGLGLLARKFATKKKGEALDYAAIAAENTAHREALRAEMRANNEALIGAIRDLGDEMKETRHEIIHVNEQGRDRFLEIATDLTKALNLLANSMTAANTKLDFIVSRTNGK